MRYHKKEESCPLETKFTFILDGHMSCDVHILFHIYTFYPTWKTTPMIKQKPHVYMYIMYV